MTITKIELEQKVEEAVELVAVLKKTYDTAQRLGIVSSVTEKKVETYEQLVEVRQEELKNLKYDEQPTIPEDRNEETDKLMKIHILFTRLSNLSKSTIAEIKRCTGIIDSEIKTVAPDAGELERLETIVQFNKLLAELPKSFSARQDYSSLYLTDSFLNNFVNDIQQDIDKNYYQLINDYKNLDSQSHVSDYKKAISEFNQFKINHDKLEAKAQVRHDELKASQVGYEGKMETTKNQIKIAKKLMARASIFDSEEAIKKALKKFSILVNQIDKKDYVSNVKGVKTNFKENYEILTSEWKEDLDKLQNLSWQFEEIITKKENQPQFKEYKEAMQLKDNTLAAARDVLLTATPYASHAEFKELYSHLDQQLNKITAKKYLIETQEKGASFEEKIGAVANECLKDMEVLTQLTLDLGEKTNNYIEKKEQNKMAIKASIEKISSQINDQMQAFDGIYKEIVEKLIKHQLKTDSVEAILNKLNRKNTRSGDVSSEQSKLKFLSEKLKTIQNIRKELDDKIREKDEEISIDIYSKKIENILDEVKSSREFIKSTIDEHGFCFNATENEIYSKFNSLTLVPEKYKDITSSGMMKSVLENAEKKQSEEFNSLLTDMTLLVELHKKAKFLSQQNDFDQLILLINAEAVKETVGAVKLLQAYGQYLVQLPLNDLKSDKNMLQFDENGRKALAKYIQPFVMKGNKDAVEIAKKLELINALADNKADATSLLGNGEAMQAFETLETLVFGHEFVKEETLGNSYFCKTIETLTTSEISLTHDLLTALADKDKSALIYYLSNTDAITDTTRLEKLLDLAAKAEQPMVESIKKIITLAPQLVQPWLFVFSQDEKVRNENLRTILSAPNTIESSLPFLEFLFFSPTANMRANWYFEDSSEVSTSFINRYFREYSHTALDKSLTRNGYLKALNTMSNHNDFAFLSQVFATINKLYDDASVDEKEKMNSFRAQAVTILLNPKITTAMKEALILEKGRDTFPPIGWPAQFFDRIKSCINAIFAVREKYRCGFFERENSHERRILKEAVSRKPNVDGAKQVGAVQQEEHSDGEKKLSR